jgi:hypothetical protein
MRLRELLFSVGGAIVGVLAVLAWKKRQDQDGDEPDDRPPVVVSNGSSVTIEAGNEEAADEWNCQKGKKWSDTGSFVQDTGNLKLYRHKHSSKAPGLLLIKVSGTTNQLDDEYIIKGQKVVEVETTHCEFKIGIDDKQQMLYMNFTKGNPDTSASQNNRLVLSDVNSKKEKLKKATIPLKKDEVKPEFGVNGRIEVRSRHK